MFFFFKQKTADEMRSSDWSSDVCSSDIKKKLNALLREVIAEAEANPAFQERLAKALGPDEKPVKAPVERERQLKQTEHKRPSKRRTPAVLDPVPQTGRASCRDGGCKNR